MRKKVYSIIVVILVLFIAMMYILYTRNINQVNRFYNEFEGSFNSGVAIELHNNGIRQLCNYRPNYRININGDSYFIDFEKNEFIENGGVLSRGSNLTEEEFFSKTKLDREKVLSYIDFLKQNNISCIEEDINLKTGTKYAIAFKFGSYSNEKIGYMFISDDTLHTDVNTKYLSDTYKTIERTSTANWYKFEFNTDKNL